MGYSDRELFEKRLYAILYSKFTDRKTKVSTKLSYKGNKQAQVNESVERSTPTTASKESNMEPIAKGTSLSQELDSLFKLIQASPH